MLLQSPVKQLPRLHSSTAQFTLAHAGRVPRTKVLERPACKAHRMTSTEVLKRPVCARTWTIHCS